MSITHTRGKVTLATLLAMVAFFVLAVIFDVQYGGHTASVQATSTATTTVTVLNTPPAWTVSARELYASATSSPTNVGSTTVWTATATDNNAESYYFLVCKSSTTPTQPNMPGNPIPQCGGGSTDQWGISALTASAVAATVSTGTPASMAEKNDWFGYICDANAGSPRCNATMYNGLHEAGPASATSSPFIVNHPASFTLVADDSPKAPGEVVTWTSTATDTTDVIRGGDSLTLYVCKAQDFSAVTPGCGGGGAWAVSFATTQGGPSTSTTIAIPTQDKDYPAYVYVIDQFNLVATGVAQDTDTTLRVSNSAPYVTASTIDLRDAANDYLLNLTVPEGETPGFKLRFTVLDDNGCQNASTSNEVKDVDINVYRSTAADPAGALCDSLGEYNANNCYTDRSPNFVPTCTASTTQTCLPSTLGQEWECTFPLWYIADPTDLGSVQAGEDWRAHARGTDDGFQGGTAATGAYATSTAPAGTSEMVQFLSFRATGSPIAYGSWEPGQGNPKHSATTTLYAIGNTGINQWLSGDPMCTALLGCTYNATSTIWVPSQHYTIVSSNTDFQTTPDNVTTFELSTTTAPVFVNMLIGKTTATSSPREDDTYWAILVPSTITYAGDYIGKNYLDAAIAPSGEW